MRWCKFGHVMGCMFWRGKAVLESYGLLRRTILGCV